ncbi:MAG: tetratricopeptide repeat protein [Acidobacteriota bacterium]|nr:tetratricopeptide repeat protein [Acidobacteriota bacterium]
MCRAPLLTAWGFVLVAGLALGAQSAPGQPLTEARRALAAGEAAAAVPPLVESFSADPQSPEGRDVLWTLARGAAPHPDVVEAVFRRAGELGSDGWIAAGVLLRRGLRPLDALEAFDRGARARPPGDSLADVEAGWLFMELHADERALARFERHPTDPRAAYARAMILARSSRFDEAAAVTDALLRHDPQNPAALLLRAELLDSGGRGSEALAMLRPLVDATGPGGPAALRLARILVKLERSPEALPILEAILAAEPDNALARLALAQAHQDAGRPQEAEGAFRRALAADDALNEARFRLARLLARTGRPEEAGPVFAEFERRNAVDAESTRLLAEAELRPDDFAAAAAFVNHALRNRDLGLAVRAAQRFLIEVPEDPERHLLVARVFREGGNTAEAQRLLRRGLLRFAGDKEAERRLEAGLAAIGVR